MTAARMTSTLSRAEYTLEIDRDVVEVRMGPRHTLDPAWSFTDAAGHGHSSYDTLESVVTSTYWCGECRDDHDESEWRCRECGETIAPAYVWTTETIDHFPGLARATLSFPDGRVYRLSDAELRGLTYRDGELEPDGIAAITARIPDDVKHP